jgi:hypothetical protein
MSFTTTALDRFRNVNLQGQNAIANIGENNSITQKGSYYRIGWVFRSSETEKANKAVRTELLQSLGNAFGLNGMSKNKDGVTIFSKGFMAKLEKLLGADFKKDDFKIGPDGTVSSGKPLTQRRISAIINRAEVAAGIKFDAKGYKAKLALINAEVAKLPEGYQKDHLTSYYAHVAKSIDFLDKDLEKLVVDNEDFRPGFEDEIPLFFFKNPKTGETSKMMVRAPFVNYLANNVGLFHFEQYKSLPQRLKSPEDLKANMDYVRNTTTLYVQEAIDIFLDAKEAGKLPELTNLICKDPGACMDAKASRTGSFRVDLGLLAPDVNMNEIDLVADHGPDTNLDKCIYEEIRIANAKNQNAKGWADLAKTVKKELVGLIRPIMTVNENNQIVPLMENGQQVVRAVTPADIDKLGPVCTATLRIFD